MIINTGQRTDIPAFYSEWFINRIKEGFVYVRNPYYPKLVTKYILDPSVVDCICFCTKNPHNMLDKMEYLEKFNQLWFVTITPYGKDIEPNVPNKHQIIDEFIKLSNIVGKDKVIWRYDPIFINEKYSITYHIRAFETMCSKLTNHTNTCVISFIDLYQKVIKNFKGVKEVTDEEKQLIGKNFFEIANKYNITLQTCCEGDLLTKFSILNVGCQNKDVIEKATNLTLEIPKNIKPARELCDCLLGNDIGQYDTCNHGCIYCYANYNKKNVIENMKKHNPNSHILIGKIEDSDIVKEAKQTTYVKF